MLKRMKKLELAREFARSLQDVASEKIILYGSVARGDDTEESDVDILVVSKEKRSIKERVIRKAMDMLLETGTYISVKVLPPDEYEQLQDTHFVRQIRTEGVVIG
jgi:predicted nucleotidyltransferase